SSQFVDDNTKLYTIRDHIHNYSGRNLFTNVISQTLFPNREGPEVYKHFHFVPGDSKDRAALRKDGRFDAMKVTPGGSVVSCMLDSAFSSGNIYAMGIAAHAYCDSWAHQNFTCEWSSFNSEADMPSVGHMLELTKPDRIANVWHDRRLIDVVVVNRDRFLDAAVALFRKLRVFVDPKCDVDVLEADALSLREDIDGAVGERDDEDVFLGDRIARYKALALTREYGGEELVDYDKDEWFDAIVKHKVEQGRGYGTARRVYFFLRHYKKSDWFRFQQAVKRGR
nr:hypothetical protein [Kiritimatiellia bacterium]